MRRDSIDRLHCLYRIVCRLAALLVSLIAPCAQAQQSEPSAWQAEAPRYGYATAKDILVRMDDGIVLRADEYFPTDQATGSKAAGRFPVLLVQTPYGKERAVQKLADYFVRRGYVLAIADLRGFGNSQGQAAWFGARMGKDGAALVDWAAHLDEADGKVGLIGCSYLGIAQFFTANALPPNSPVKAMAPFCVDSNFYRDLTAFGGIPTQFAQAFRSVMTPGVEDDLATDPLVRMIMSEATGEDAFYNDYWASLNVTNFMPKIVSLNIPVLTQAGWHDIFPAGNLDVTLAAQNAYGHRAVGQALRRGSPVSDRYQAIVGNWTHAEHTGDTLLPVMLAWFDKWLKDKDNAFSRPGMPFHIYMLGANRWIDTATFPITDKVTTFRLLPESPYSGSLTNDDKTCGSADCSQVLMWAPEGPGATLTFDTGKLDAPLNITGPGNVTLYVRSSRPDIELSASIFEVDPDGHITKLTNGAQLGSRRALNAETSWYGRDGTLVRPDHYFTKAMSSPVPVGRTVRIDIELLPLMIRIPAGHRLRLVLATQPADDFRQYGPAMQLPNPLTPTPEEYSNLVGGIYTISFGNGAPSVLNLSTASDSDLVSSKLDWGPGN